jgi:hypothetical protein
VNEDIDFSADAAPAEDSLKRVQRLAALLVEQAQEVIMAQQAATDAMAAFQRTERTDLPELMREVGLTELVLADGSKVKLTDEFECSLTRERKASGLSWLKDNGYGGLIKTVVSLDFDRGEGEKAQELANKVMELTGREAVVQEDVHASTLKSFIRERREKGETPPEDIFGIHPFTRAALTLPGDVKVKAKKK